MLLQDPPFPLFLGTNVPWNKFGYDIGGGAWDRRWFESYFKSISGTQNTVRFFLHCDGRASPHFGEDGRVVGLARPEHGGAGTFSRELAELVALTRENRLVLQICLWSFDMCRSNGFPVRSNLIADPAISQSYVDNALQPFLESLDAAGCEHCMLEVINEPEWCIDDPKLDRCSAATCVSAAAMQRFVAMVTANIHGHSPQRKVTVGAASLKWSAPTANGRSVADLWTDSALIIAASTAHVENVGRPTIDLFNTHFWNWQERVDGYGPCNVDDASFWMASKPIVFAELPAHIHSHVDRHSAELLECILKRGFNGGLFWAYNDPGSLLEDAGATLTKATSTLPHEAASFEALMAYVRSPTPPHPLPPPPGPPPPRPGPPGMEQSPTPTDDQSYTPCSRVADCDVACPGSSYTFCWTYGLPTIGGVPHKAWQSVCWGQAHHLTCAGITNGKPPPDGAPGQCYSDVWRQYPCPAGRPTATLQTFPPAASFRAERTDPPRPPPPHYLPPPPLTDDQSYTPCSRVADCDVACPGSSYTFCWTYGLPTIGGVPHKAWQSVCWGQAHHLTCAGITNGKPPPDGAPGQCYSDVWRQYPCPAGRPTATLQTFPPAASFHAGPSCGYTYPPHPQPPPRDGLLLDRACHLQLHN